MVFLVSRRGRRLKLRINIYIDTMLPLALLFVLLSSPATYRLTSRLGGAMIASAAGCPTHLGVLLHAVVFVVVVAAARRSEGFTTRIPVTEVKLIKTVPTVFSSKEMGTKTLPVGYFSVGGGRVGYRIAGHATSVLYTNQSSALYAYRHPGHRNENMTVYILSPPPRPPPSPPRRQVKLLSAVKSTSKPVLPAGHFDTGVPQATIDAIQRYMLAKVAAQKAPYTPARDAYAWLLANKRTFKSESRYNELLATVRGPSNPQETMLMGYFQRVTADLILAVAKAMPGSDVSRRLSRNSADGLVAFTRNDFQGQSIYLENGKSIMVVNPTFSIAKTYNIIAHELAHNAFHPKSELSPEDMAGVAAYGSHGWLHTQTWTNFLRVGLGRLGWEFVAWYYPNCCTTYNICDMSEWDPARVYNGNPMAPMKNARFVGWPTGGNVTAQSTKAAPVVTGRSGAGVTAEVERYYAAELLKTDKYVLDRSRVGVLVTKSGVNMVAPRTPAEAQRLAFFQKHIADLLNEVQRRMPGSPIAVNLKKVYRGKVGLNIGEKQQAMISTWDAAGRADFIMAIPPVESSQPISKLMMIIVHEIAHAALSDPVEGGSNPLKDNNGKGTPGYDGGSVGHGPRHTAMWKSLTAIAISLGWKYIAITYPSQCERYKFCDIHTIPGARGVVFSIDKPIPGL
jgi:hypothetical protein